MRRFGPWLAAGMLITFSRMALASPAWTRDGNCASCHTSTYNNLIDVFGQDGTAKPGGHDELKVFRAPRNQIKSFQIAAGGLTGGDQYAFGVKGFRYGGITSGATLAYKADCDWANWGGSPGTYTYNELSLQWGIDPSSVPYDVTINSTAIYDYYELTFMVAGRSAAGDLFYAEERAYLQVRPPNTPPLVAIVSPADGAIIQGAPLDVTISANASDPGGSVVKVEFFVNGAKIGEDADAPYAAVWANAAQGDYTLTAKATDNDGTVTTSAALRVTVTGTPGDFDNDGDVDQTDYGHLQACLSGGEPIAPGCGDAELTGENQINNLDVAVFRKCISGSGVRGDPTCDD